MENIYIVGHLHDLGILNANVFVGCYSSIAKAKWAIGDYLKNNTNSVFLDAWRFNADRNDIYIQNIKNGDIIKICKVKNDKNFN